VINRETILTEVTEKLDLPISTVTEIIKSQFDMVKRNIRENIIDRSIYIKNVGWFMHRTIEDELTAGRNMRRFERDKIKKNTTKTDEDPINFE